MSSRASTTVRYEARKGGYRSWMRWTGSVTDFEPPWRIDFRETLRWLGSDLLVARPG
jgi:hypothetical protein